MTVLRLYKIISAVIFFLFIDMKYNAQPCGSCGTKKHERFRLLKKEGLHIDTNKVKVNGVYVNKYISETGAISYSFLRFFTNGKVFISCEYCGSINPSDFGNFNYGKFGEFKLEGDLIKMEVFATYPRYYYAYYEIKNYTLRYKYTQDRKRFGAAKLESTPELNYVFQTLR